jgi:hypothetical protein
MPRNNQTKHVVLKASRNWGLSANEETHMIYSLVVAQISVNINSGMKKSKVWMS